VRKKTADLNKPKVLMMGKLYSFTCRILAVWSVKNILVELEWLLNCTIKTGDTARIAV